MANEQKSENVGSSVQTGGLRSFTPTQLFFLTRLSWLIRQRRELVNTLDETDWRLKLLNKALYSTFLDCVEEGVGDEARSLLAQQNQHAN
ncbi:MAG: hypothetical protein QOF51_2077 [Chloroflexota bacterium]|jgi:hypothetical protein|nr:hypothetical protein [Chloroflexota bacterium]